MRIQKRNIPSELVKCNLWGCAYNSILGFCDDPRINKGNSDAACHRMSNKRLLTHLTQREADLSKAGACPVAGDDCNDPTCPFCN
jgi:hypothetical protein